MTDVREITLSEPSFARSPISTSVIPSEKYSCSGSPERFSSGRTAMERIGEEISAAGISPGRSASILQPTTAATPRSTSSPAADAARRFDLYGVSGGWACASSFTRNTCTGSGRFLTVCSPRSSYSRSSLLRSWSRSVPGDTDPAGLRERLQPRGDVHPVPEDRVVLRPSPRRGEHRCGTPSCARAAGGHSGRSEPTGSRRAQRTAFTALANSARKLSPVKFTQAAAMLAAPAARSPRGSP